MSFRILARYICFKDYLQHSTYTLIISSVKLHVYAPHIEILKKFHSDASINGHCMQLQIHINDFPSNQPLARTWADIFQDGVAANLFANKTAAGEGILEYGYVGC